MNIKKIREDFPLLEKKINGKPIIYFDNACMSLKPKQVIEKELEYYKDYTACAGRSLHKLGRKVDDEVKNSRKLIQKFINAKSENEIIFSKNTTESINLIAYSLDLKASDKVITTDKEHNSNLIPWQIKGTKHGVILSNTDNTFNINNFCNLIKGTKLVSMVYTSNLDGTTIPAKEVIKIAHENGALVLLDAAQTIPHQEVNVRKLDVDFLAFSGHKMLGPTGTGVLYGKYDLLKELKPFIVGGDTVVESTYKTAEFQKPPEKFEAGLQNYAGIIGLNAAVKYLMNIGMEEITKHEVKLNKRITDALFDKLKLIGPKSAELRNGIFSFNIPKIQPHEIAFIMDAARNIMIRSGAHCVHSWFNAHNLNGSARASLYLYNTEEEVEAFIEEINKIAQFSK